MRRALTVFAREPVAGRVKTRLAEGIGTAGAARVYAVLLEYTLAAVGQSEVESMVSLATDPSGPWAAKLELSYEIQGRGDLGKRMSECFARRFSDGAKSAVIIGSDNARLRSDHIHSAFTALDRFPIVLGPADDGGYWLVGQRSPGVDLFSTVPWSSSETLDATRSRLRALAVEWHELETLPDIDTEEDLKRAMVDPRVPEILRAALASATNDSDPSRDDPEGD